MYKPSDHVSDIQLRVLLFGEEDGDDTTKIEAHVETCHLCQQRISQFVQTDSIEQEASDILSSQYQVSSNQKDGSNEDDAILLGAPSQPEMLGRIGRYEIESRIGSGGMGIVFKGIDTELNRPVAIKFLAPYLARNGAARQRFSRESRAAAAVVHEHVVAIHDVESNGEYPYLVMQYVSGESLQARVDRMGPLGVEQILRIGIQTASGLQAAHQQGIVHRDVKPGNILLEDSVERVLLTDFGLARTVDDASLTHTGVVAGTPHYMSPEQANGDTVDLRSDLFSLGSVLYFVATGHPPFRAERAMGVLHRICRERHRPAWESNAALPDELSEVIDRLLEKRPSKRYVSASAVQGVLTRFLQQRQTRTPGWSSRLRTWGRRHKIASWVIAILAMGVAFAVIRFPVNRFRNDQASTNKTSHTLNSESKKSESNAPIATNANVDPTKFLNADLSSTESNKFRRELSQVHRLLDQLESKFTAPNDSSLGGFGRELFEIEQSLKSIDPNNRPF